MVERLITTFRSHQLVECWVTHLNSRPLAAIILDDVLNKHSNNRLSKKQFTIQGSLFSVFLYGPSWIGFVPSEVYQDASGSTGNNSICRESGMLSFKISRYKCVWTFHECIIYLWCGKCIFVRNLESTWLWCRMLGFTHLEKKRDQVIKSGSNIIADFLISKCLIIGGDNLFEMGNFARNARNFCFRLRRLPSLLLIWRLWWWSFDLMMIVMMIIQFNDDGDVGCCQIENLMHMCQ